MKYLLHITKIVVRNSTSRRGHVPIGRNGHAFQLARSAAITLSPVQGARDSATGRRARARTLPERPAPRLTSRPPCLPAEPSFTLHFLIGEVKTIGSLHLDLFTVQTHFICSSCVASGVSCANPLFAFVCTCYPQ